MIATATETVGSRVERGKSSAFSHYLVRWTKIDVVLYTALIAAMPSSVYAHVKWFAPYIVGAPPAPVFQTLRDGWFWLGIALVLAFFLAARLFEVSGYGDPVLDLLDRLTEPLWHRLDDYVRAIVAAFFVAIFSVGGI